MPTILLLHGVQSSGSTWWRVAEDLHDLGFDLRAPDLAGHGSRASSGPDLLTVEALADDVAARLDGPVDAAVGHSLGAVVALVLAARHPDLVGGVVLEDPPGLTGGVDPDRVADEVLTDSAAARADPGSFLAAVLAENPAWSTREAADVLASRLALDDVRVARSIRGADWDLPALVASCPVPVALIAAVGPGTALQGSDRDALLAAIPPDRVTEIRSGHGVHRDRPALFLEALLRMLDELVQR